MKKLPSDGSSLIDAIRGERLADQVVARRPDEVQVRTWIQDHFGDQQAMPFKNQMSIHSLQGGIFAFPIGLLLLLLLLLLYYPSIHSSAKDMDTTAYPHKVPYTPRARVPTTTTATTATTTGGGL